MDQNKFPHDPRRLGLPSGVSKMISEPMARSAQTVHQSCIKISSISKRSELSLEPRHLGVPSGASETISEPMYVWRNPRTYLLLTLTPSTNGANEIPHDTRHLGVPSGVSKTISEPRVR